MPKSLFPAAWIATFWLTLFVTYGIYSWGFSGTLQFDDEANLGWLAYATTPETALLFITSGAAGPLGRPLALASFYLLHVGHWPHELAPMFRANVLIHLLNGVLVLWLFTLIGIAGKKTPWFGLTVAALWLLQPMLASTSLMVVQRMTSLSATFVLLGLLLHVAARRHIATRPVSALAAMTFSLLFFGALAVLTKENGVLLLGYILVLEYTLLPANGFPETRRLQQWRLFLLWLPAVAALLVLLWKLPDIAASYSSRPFSLLERLQTQTVILLDYARLLSLPVRSALSPFRDDYPVVADLVDPAFLIAAMLIAAALAAAWMYRARLPYFAFAVFWFLAGHSMESTIIPLELYFEHRNYLPAVGIAALIATMPWRLPSTLAHFARLAILLYGLGLAFVLGQTTSLWGQPLLAATLWHEAHPGSERAALRLSAEYSLRGDHAGVLRVLATTAQHRPRSMGLAATSLYALCHREGEAEFRVRLGDTLEKLQTSQLNFAAIDAIEKLASARYEHCPWVSDDTITALVDAIMHNPRAMANHFVRARMHRIKATLAWRAREFDVYVLELERQFLADPQLGSGLALIQAFLQADLLEATQEKLTLVEAYTPRHPLQRRLWQKQLAAVREHLASRLPSQAE